ncbi:uncharacterized protein AC631_02374 [Debaryomyces fabryi]|uniref:Uncharacterized protein n=1 Tax=Debaryomyces fabryi TaxID=58627 RepID=A0A0V1Q012_9ASCO|nr:uncharacterized protein AC631_02374 [Debaryomyces fabryi]KSA01841.1 hypothetical protein AC631_02374 [Debaryomyces fabryi]CUM45596.1 unnamed protein product [Debaryomyces fabryi]
MDKLFLDQTFKLYKSNDTLPQLTQPQLDYVSTIICQYLFQTLANDIISEYRSYQDLFLDFKITHSVRQFNQYTITYISVRHRGLLPRQTIIFIKSPNNNDKNRPFNTLVMIKATNASLLSVLIQAIENLATEFPIIIRELKFTEEYLSLIIDNVSSGLTSINNYAEVIGDVELIYLTNHLVSNDSLRNIIINIPEKDIQNLADSKGLISNINGFLKRTSQINFNNIPLIRFTSRLINLSREGKLKISSDKLHLVRDMEFNDYISTSNQPQNDALEGQENLFVWFLIGSIYNENLTTQF